MASACRWLGFQPRSNRRLSPPGGAVVNPGPTPCPQVRVVRLFAIGPTTIWTTPLAHAQNGHHRLSIVQERYSLSVRAALQITATPNNGLQLTRAARCAPSPSDWGQSLRAALAAEAGCSAYTQVRDERTRGSGRMSDHHAKVEGPESRPNLARVVGVAGQSTWVAGRISGLPVARPSTQVQWQPACREAPCPRSWCGSRSGRGFTTARLSAWAKGGRSASDASPHHLVRSAGMASGSTDTLKASRLLQ